MLIDDILLYRLAPEGASEEIWLEAESATITAPMEVYDDPAASGGKCIGTQSGTGDSTSNPPDPAGTARIPFTVVKGGTYSISGRVIIPSGESFWIRIQGATTNTNNHSSGWVRWSDPPTISSWYWDIIFSADDGNSDVEWTMQAGNYILEVGYREDGALLDAIVITKID